LVVKTEPSGAQIFLDGALKGASDSNFSLSPAFYDVEIKKTGFLTWSKRIQIEKETVSQINVSLFRSVPALAPLTENGVTLPVSSPDLTKIAFADPSGLWVIETLNFPIGFSRDPRQIATGNFLTNAAWEFSPNGRNLLLTTPQGAFLLDTGSLTPQSQMVNIASKKEVTLTNWRKEKETKLNSLEKNLPEEIKDVLSRKTAHLSFSPDESKVLYTASASASLTPNLIPPVPGASSQTESRQITIDHTYVYDIKEDRNFLIEANPVDNIFWLLSNNLVLVEEGKITVLDYDGTNRQTVFSGQFTFPFVFPFVNTSKLLILTSLGAVSPPNLYSLSIK
jgi:hypothetical protein